MTSKVSTVETKMPKISEIASPLKIGSSRMKVAPIIAASAVSAMGLARIAPGAHHRVLKTAARTQLGVDEVHQQNGIAHDDAGQRDHADHRRGGELCAEQARVLASRR